MPKGVPPAKPEEGGAMRWELPVRIASLPGLLVLRIKKNGDVEVSSRGKAAAMLEGRRS
jgi:hypothetical protein